jgi:hypothetical protein
VPIQDPTDVLSQVCVRNSTRGWSPINRNTELISFRLPSDFGSAEYYERRKEILDTWVDGVGSAENLVALYDALLPQTDLIRDYLWATDEETIELGRRALQAIPRETVSLALSWAIKDFWRRQPGWPDFLVIGKSSYTFCEVKSRHDGLSQAQMQWFTWAMASHVPCEIIMVRNR